MRCKFTLYERNLAALQQATAAKDEAERAMYADDTFSTRDRFIKARTAYENAYGRVRGRESRLRARFTLTSAEAAVAAADRACGLAYDARHALRSKQGSTAYARAQEAFAKARHALEQAEIDLRDVQTAKIK